MKYKVYFLSLLRYLRDKLIDIRLRKLDEKNKFRLIYKTGYWKPHNFNSLSGVGSEEFATKNIAFHLPKFIKQYDIKSILDIPCGDWNWMQKLDFEDVEYIGADIVDEIIENNLKFKKDKVDFKVINIIEDKLPDVDLIFIRDLFVHLTENDIKNSIANISRSNIKFVALTSFKDCVSNSYDIRIGDRWRKINMQLHPFNFPDPLETLPDSNDLIPDDKYKYIGIWKVEEIKRLNIF